MPKRKTPTIFARSKNSFYPTPREAFEPLRPHLATRHNARWKGLEATRFEFYVEPCAGDGALSRMLVSANCTVVAQFDIAPQIPNIQECDARLLTKAAINGATVSVTNPPWPEPHSDGEPTVSIITHMLTLCDGWWLLPADFMHNVYAAELMRRCTKIISIGRVKWMPGSEFVGLENCCWYYFSGIPNNGKLEFIPNAGRAGAVLPDPLVEASRQRRAAHQPCPPADENPQTA